jgi:hypothetical protein
MAKNVAVGKSKPKPHTINVWEQDPGLGAQPDGGQVINRPAPKLSAAPLPIKIENPIKAPPARIHATGTPGFRYWTAAEALRRGADFWGGLLPGVSWQVGALLPIDLDNGQDLNAYYDRVGLRFFHDTVNGRTIYSGESPDVVCHELGHAVLDSIKPQLWDTASNEVAAFHESFGDMSAILAALQLPSLRQSVLAETNGVLYRVSRLSRLAEQLGWAIRQKFSSAVDPDCLRNAVNSLFYRDPSTLPPSGPATSLSSESHSFSRVFTGAFFEGLAGMLKAHPTQDEATLLQVSQDIGKILVDAVRQVPVVPTFFSQVAATMIHTANQQFAALAYGVALQSAFVRHGIVPAATSVVLAAPPAQAVAGVAAGAAPDTSLPQLSLSISEYGLGVDSIMVQAAGQPKKFDVAGAALSLGVATSPSAEAAAKAFVENLVRQGRLKAPGVTGNAEIVRSLAPSSHETHTHELRREGQGIMLRRVRIACDFRECHCHWSEIQNHCE